MQEAVQTTVKLLEMRPLLQNDYSSKSSFYTRTSNVASYLCHHQLEKAYILFSKPGTYTNRCLLSTFKYFQILRSPLGPKRFLFLRFIYVCNSPVTLGPVQKPSSLVPPMSSVRILTIMGEQNELSSSETRPSCP